MVVSRRCRLSDLLGFHTIVARSTAEGALLDVCHDRGGSFWPNHSYTGYDIGVPVFFLRRLSLEQSLPQEWLALTRQLARRSCLAESNAIQFVRGVCGTKTRAYPVQVSDQRGTCLVEKPAKGGLCPQQPLNLITFAHRSDLE